jgi:hypothetical protein
MADSKTPSQSSTPESAARADHPLLIQYWHTAEPPEEIVELMAGFDRLNPGLRHLLFDAAEAERFIGEHFSGREVAAFRACALPTSQADYLRYCAAYVLGGLCIDADFRCVGGLDSLFRRSTRGTVFGQRDAPPAWIARLAGWPYTVGPYRTLVNGIFVFARPGDPLLELAIEVTTANIEHRVGEGPVGVWRTTGPGVFTSFYLLHHLGSIDIFLRYSKDTILERSARLFCEVVGDRSRVDRALHGLDMLAVEETIRWLEHVGIPRASSSVRHWSNAEQSIFR